MGEKRNRFKTRTIRQSVTFKAPSHEVYDSLMDSRRHAKFTGGTCTVSRRIGGRFSVYDGYITGENVELIPDKKIVQLWKPEEDCWPPDYYSKVTFVLKPTEMGRASCSHKQVFQFGAATGSI